MIIAASFQRVLNEYIAARRQSFAGHAIASVLRDDLAIAIDAAINDPSRYLCTGSAGMGVWARGPWVGVFDRLVTTSAQTGIYPVYLFREDMTGVYLSLNQGMTEARERYGSDAKTALRAKAVDLRAFLGNKIGAPFDAKNLDLRASASSNPTAFYEAGNICSVFYKSTRVPNDEKLKADLVAMLDLYDQATDFERVPMLPTELAKAASASILMEDGTKTRKHERIERNPALARRAKEVHGYKCQACSFDYAKTYGTIGKNFIEAHHLIPLAALKDRRVALDPKTDFAVLCASCHRMIHRTKFISDIAGFKSAHLTP